MKLMVMTWTAPVLIGGLDPHEMDLLWGEAGEQEEEEKRANRKPVRKRRMAVREVCKRELRKAAGQTKQTTDRERRLDRSGRCRRVAKKWASFRHYETISEAEIYVVAWKRTSSSHWH